MHVSDPMQYLHNYLRHCPRVGSIYCIIILLLLEGHTKEEVSTRLNITISIIQLYMYVTYKEGVMLLFEMKMLLNFQKWLTTLHTTKVCQLASLYQQCQDTTMQI